MNEVSDKELKKVIADFLEMGLVENIIAMFRRDERYYGWTGELLLDQRLNVRLGIAILFEELQVLQPEKTPLAIPGLEKLLHHDSSLIRGEAIGILGIIDTSEANKLITSMMHDSNPQVREMVAAVLDDAGPEEDNN